MTEFSVRYTFLKIMTKRIVRKQKKKTSPRLVFFDVLVFLFLFLLPTQLGKHFFFDFSYISAVRIDYLAPTLFLTDIIALLLIVLNIKNIFFIFKNKYFLLFI